MAALEDLLTRLEGLVHDAQNLDEAAQEVVFELLDGVDALHRWALNRLEAGLDQETIDRLRAADPAVAWLFDLYGVGVDQRAVVESALDGVRPYISSHGGAVEVVDVVDGVVRLRMSGSCSGCTASAVTLQQGIEEALRDGFPGFAHIEVEDEDAPAHPPPGPTLLQIGPRPR